MCCANLVHKTWHRNEFAADPEGRLRRLIAGKSTLSRNLCGKELRSVDQSVTIHKRCTYFNMHCVRQSSSLLLLHGKTKKHSKIVDELTRDDLKWRQCLKLNAMNTLWASHLMKREERSVWSIFSANCLLMADLQCCLHHRRPTVPSEKEKGTCLSLKRGKTCFILEI